MCPRSLAPLAITLALLASGCGSKPQESSSPAPSASAPSPAATEIPAVSPYDSGPRAGESPVNAALAEAGEKLFQTKGCSACHTWGKKMSGPDLHGVTFRRTAQWMENQILHPEVMVKTDPISRQLFAQMALQMPNQGLKPDEAKSVIEFLKKKDHDAGLTKPAQ